MLKHFVGECLDSKFASVDKGTTEKLLALLPPQSKAKGMLRDFFDVVHDCARIFTMGSLSTPAQINANLKGIEQFRSTLTAFGQAEGPHVTCKRRPQPLASERST